MRLKRHLEKTYSTKIGYGTVVQLCLVHNKRLLSARRYWGVAGLKSRRARKGFNVRLNIDAHWSCAFYKCLDYVQLKDGRNKFILNRDDAAGFRLDTTYTHNQHKILGEAERPEVTTRTDYVNKYNSILQTTSYLFMATDTTAEMPVGIVKAQKVFPQFNRVELLNGCLTVGHSNVFIPSTILGSNFNAEGIDQDRLESNLGAATETYINTVSGTKCSGNPILLLKGCRDDVSRNNHERRDHLLTFLQGSKKNQLLFKKNYPDEYKYFTKVWDVRNNHMVKDLPDNYIFILLPCYQKKCPPPRCRDGKPSSPPVWFEGVPSLTTIPLPIPHPEK